MRATAPLQKALRRLAFTTKMVNGGYYKGNRTGSMGRHTKHGAYIVEPRKVRTYVAPAWEDLKNFKLTPFVTKNMEPLKGDFKGERLGGMSGKLYLERWKVENGVD